MNATHSNEGDARLGRLLQEWNTDSALPPRFQEAVWRRIAHADTPLKVPGWAELRKSFEAAFRQPALAIAYVTALMIVGIGAGLLQAREKASQVDHTLQARYLQTVDPYLKTR